MESDLAASRLATSQNYFRAFRQAALPFAAWRRVGGASFGDWFVAKHLRSHLCMTHLLLGSFIVFDIVVSSSRVYFWMVILAGLNHVAPTRKRGSVLASGARALPQSQSLSMQRPDTSLKPTASKFSVYRFGRGLVGGFRRSGSAFRRCHPCAAANFKLVGARPSQMASTSFRRAGCLRSGLKFSSDRCVRFP
jgi:hypothetical protein